MRRDFIFYSSFTDNMSDAYEAIRTLTSFAAELGLDGNIWQHWLAYKILSDENAFSLACERHRVRTDSTLMTLASADLDVFYEMLKGSPAGAIQDENCGRDRIAALELMTDYCPPYEGDVLTAPGRRIREFSKTLAAADTPEKFRAAVAQEYEKYGAGMYGLYRAFRISPEGTDIVPVTELSDVTFDDLIGYDSQKATLRSNTAAFVNGEHANNVLLYGDSGTGKSTSVHALMHDFWASGLRLIEIGKQHRHLMPQVISDIKKRNYRFIIFLDDLSFEEDESDYKELKAMLEGALESREDRVLIYATSNRRHLIRETWGDRADMEYHEDIHRSDTMEEKLSLASRFGVTIYYSKPGQAEYLNIVRELAARNGIELKGTELEDAARKWELRHGGMSGRTASQLITWLGGNK